MPIVFRLQRTKNSSPSSDQQIKRLFCSMISSYTSTLSPKYHLPTNHWTRATKEHLQMTTQSSIQPTPQSTGRRRTSTLSAHNNQQSQSNSVSVSSKKTQKSKKKRNIILNKRSNKLDPITDNQQQQQQPEHHHLYSSKQLL